MANTGWRIRNAKGTGIIDVDGVKIGQITQPRTVLSGTMTIDPPSLTTGNFAEGDLTLTGVALGDRVELYPPYDMQGIIAKADVQAANNITVSWTSCNAGTVDLASGTWGYAVIRRV